MPLQNIVPVRKSKCGHLERMPVTLSAAKGLARRAHRSVAEFTLSEAKGVWLTNIVNQATSRHRRQANKKDGTLLFRNRFDCGERSVPSCKHCTTPRAAIYGGSCACIPSGASAN